jgi:hypothetical protein
MKNGSQHTTNAPEKENVHSVKFLKRHDLRFLNAGFEISSQKVYCHRHIAMITVYQIIQFLILKLLTKDCKTGTPTLEKIKKDLL